MKICIDAGHGGKDPGALGKRGTREKDINLDIALRLGKYLKSLGHTVIYTRTTDVWLSLSERANISNTNKCDLLISIHCNSGGGQGIETYNCPGSIKGKEYATKVQNALIKATKLTDRCVKEAKFTVIYKTNAPAILVETAFIDNSQEELLLMSEEYRDKVAKCIVEAITGQTIDVKNEPNKPKYTVNYCLEFQRWYNKTTKTRAPLKEDGLYGSNTEKAINTIHNIIKQF